MSSLPFHPITNLQAIGFTSRGPVWPAMGGSEDPVGVEDDPTEHQSSDDRGYPEGTPLEKMTDAQRAAYFKDQNKHTDRLRKSLAAFKGVTPEAVEQMQARLQKLENEKLSADEKALNEATTQASADARSATEAEWRPKVLEAQLESAAARVIKDDERLKSFMAITDPAKFAGEDGQIDREKVISHLTAIFGSGQQGGQQYRSWGQHSGGNGPAARPGDAGKAAAARRFGTTSI